MRGVDYSIAHSLNHFAVQHDGFEDPLKAYVGAAEILFLAIVVALFLIVPGRERRKAQRAAVSAAAATGIALLIAHFISTAVDRVRPFVAHPHSIHPFLAHAADPSFPSDHATAAFAIAVAVVLRQRAWGAVLLVLAAVLAVGRVFLGLHYPSDVVGGAAIGTVVALLLWAIPPVRELLDRIADICAGILGAVIDRVLPARAA